MSSLFYRQKYQKFDELLTRKTKDIKSTSRYLAAPLCARRLDLSSSWFDEIIFREFMQIVIFLKPWSVGVYSMIMLFYSIKRKVIYNVKGRGCMENKSNRNELDELMAVIQEVWPEAFVPIIGQNKWITC